MLIMVLIHIFYIFQFVCVAFAGTCRYRHPIAVER